MGLKAVLNMVNRNVESHVDADTPLLDSRLDSLGAVELRNQLQQSVGRSLPSTLVFEYPTARQLASHLQRGAPSFVPASMVALQPYGRFAPSVHGLSVMLPGGAASLEAAWCVSASGADMISEVPMERWVLLALQEPLSSRMRHGGFVVGVELFDAAAFGISSAEAAAMDPQQRLLLEHGWAALHEAGLTRSALAGSLTGVFVAISANDYGQLTVASTEAATSVYAATGSSHSIAAGRLSFVLGLHGPCVAYDTACSSGLVATHTALSTLQRGDCARALVGAVNLMLAPAVGISFAVAGMTSLLGHSHSFDARADGYARAEACAFALLTDESEAFDAQVRPMLSGGCIRQDGRSASLTAPNGLAQQALLVAALDDASMGRSWISCYEAAAVGSSLGDPVEARSLANSVLSSLDSMTTTIGSTKACIGHSEPAAGLCSLIALCSALHTAEAAPNAQLRTLNPHISGVSRSQGGVFPVQLTSLLGAARGGISLGGATSLAGVTSLAGAISLAGATSAFGYNGTIACSVVRVEAKRHRRTFSHAAPRLVWRRPRVRGLARGLHAVEASIAMAPCAESKAPAAQLYGFVEEKLKAAGFNGTLETPLAEGGLDSLAYIELCNRIINSVGPSMAPLLRSRLAAMAFNESATALSIVEATQQALDEAIGSSPYATSPAEEAVDAEDSTGSSVRIARREVADAAAAHGERIVSGDALVKHVPECAIEWSLWRCELRNPVRGPLRADESFLFYIPGIPGVCQLEFAQLCSHLPHTIVGLPYAHLAELLHEVSDVKRYQNILSNEILHEMRRIQPAGPYLLAGYSLGALLAIEIASVLERTAESVAALILLDPPVQRLGQAGGALVARTIRGVSFKSAALALASRDAVSVEDAELERLARAWQALLPLALLGCGSVASLCTRTMLLEAIKGGQQALLEPLFASLPSLTRHGFRKWVDSIAERPMELGGLGSCTRVRVEGSHLSFLRSPALAARALSHVRDFLAGTLPGSLAETLAGRCPNLARLEAQLLAWILDFLRAHADQSGLRVEVGAETAVLSLGLSSYEGKSRPSYSNCHISSLLDHRHCF